MSFPTHKKDQPQFKQPEGVSDNGAGIPLVEGSPSTSIALEGHTEPAGTFGYNSKTPSHIRKEDHHYGG